MLDDLTHPHVSFNTRHIYDSFSHIFVVIHSHSHSVLFILVHSCSFLFTNLFYLYYLLSHIILNQFQPHLGPFQSGTGY